MSLAEQIKQGRTTAGMTQRDLSRASGVPLQTIRDIEQGLTRDPRSSTLTALTVALNTPKPAADLPRYSAAGSK